jgi:opacity protein-like surface antigen
MRLIEAVLGLVAGLLTAGATAAETLGYGDSNPYGIPAPIQIAVPGPTVGPVGVAVPAPVPIPEGFTYYLRADLGWGFGGERPYSEKGRVIGADGGPFVAAAPFTVGSLGGSHNSDGVFLGTIGTGAYFTPHIRGDITLDMRSSENISAGQSRYSYVSATSPGTAVFGSLRDSFHVNRAVALANLYVDVLPRGSLSPYLGAGVGLVYNDAHRDFREIAVATAIATGLVTGVEAVAGANHATNVGLAGALMAGTTFAWNQRWAVDVGYRALYLDGVDVSTVLSNAQTSKVELGAHWEHELRVGLRYNIW